MSEVRCLTQTDLSHMRRENATQTWPPKNAATQSTRDGESQVPRPLIYLAGLRGPRGRPVFKTDLTTSVDEKKMKTAIKFNKHANIIYLLKCFCVFCLLVPSSQYVGF